ncbi:MAG: AzlD domain-containing protein [Ruminococcaceae bacterium]|nr:AzlD domain-containing protein [Oscillospiraceae bacterium]
MNLSVFFPLLLVMALTTWLVRALPFTLFRRKITNARVKTFFDLIPYTVLAAMTFPAILYATGSLPTACAGLAVALILSICERSLLMVAIGACIATLAATGVMMLLGSR